MNLSMKLRDSRSVTDRKPDYKFTSYQLRPISHDFSATPYQSLVLLIEPDVGQILSHVVAGGDVPALQLLVNHDDAVPPDSGDGVRLFERPLLELAQNGIPLLLVELARLLVEEVIEHAIDVLRVADRGTVVRQVFLQLQVGLIHEVAVEIERRIECRVVPLLGGEIKPGFQLLVLDRHPELSPLIDQEHPDRGVRHRDVAVSECEAEVRYACVLQQLARLSARGVDVAGEARIAEEFLLARSEIIARTQDPPDVAHERDFGKRLRATPAIDAERQRPTHPHVVEGLLLRVAPHQ